MPFRLLFTPLVACLILVSCEVEPSPLPTPLATVSISEKITKQEDVSRKINTPDPVYIPPTPSPIPIFSSPMVIPGDRDLEDLARRYYSDRILELESEPTLTDVLSKKKGEIETFTVTDAESAQAYKVKAELLLVTENTYWYGDTSLDLKTETFRETARRWEEDIRPEVVRNFGDIDSPGVDGDSRLTVLNTPLNGAAGYFGGQDTFPHWVHPSSNQREMVFMDPVKLPPGRNRYLAVLTHEFQHAIHNNLDPGEDSWVNEGLAEIASYSAGFESAFIGYFLANPSISLTHWPDDPSQTVPHYGAASLFFIFAAGRNQGFESLGNLAALKEDGVVGVDKWLEPLGSSFEDEFSDWIVANYVGAIDGRYSYSDWALSVTSKALPLQWGASQHSVPQFGATYLEIPNLPDPKIGTTTIVFRGEEEGRRFKDSCPNKCWWSNRGDSINTTLTVEADLTSGKNLYANFEIWHDIETDWDYAYLSASDDEGKTWKTLEASGTTTSNPSGSNYGHGYTGYKRWNDHMVSLDEYSGKNILLRFEYVTDDAVHLDGLVVGKFEIPSVGMKLGRGDGTWNANGFVLIDRPLKQRFIVRLVELLTNGEFEVSEIELDEYNRAMIETGSHGNSVSRAILVVAGASLGTQ
ncbi:MAG: hypothetical protein VX426_07230, partial [Chloroflexota bacterium]|nr:hypothetical protein [Chloroflexota bacterium]